MFKVCTSEQMREIDRLAGELGGIPPVVLMENAAISCVEEINSEVKKAVIFCGKGNNGGDGFAIARHLYNRGVEVSIYLVCGTDFKGDALINYEIISKYPIDIYEFDEAEFIDINRYDIIIDAIFGTGISGEIYGAAHNAIELINTSNVYTMSVDIPSGVNADNGQICGICVKADKTVTFAAYKHGQLLFPGADFCGELVVKNISIPEYIISDRNININVSDKSYVKSIIPVRNKNSHKGDYGKILIIGGSVGLSGAVCLAANACIKSGAGLVTVAVPDVINNIIEEKLTEPMSMALSSRDGHLDKSCADVLKNKINDFDVCLIGPGAGRSEDIVYILREILRTSEIPVIIDADGLWALSQNQEMLQECRCNVVLTPHEMEMSRICGYELEYVADNRLYVSERYATENGVTLILKGPHTVVTSVAGEQYININGNCGMATGGSGDVLAGMIAALCAVCENETQAAVLGVYLHGLSADIAVKKTGEISLVAGDIIEHIANALKLPVE
ncbi:MAG: NAD(P)H-hydrate dehydratase [Clostridia bacterium]|nr:NAD(P)H-hydrate dehydratase [Clostridia bacterium]